MSSPLANRRNPNINRRKPWDRESCAGLNHPPSTPPLPSAINRPHIHSSRTSVPASQALPSTRYRPQFPTDFRHHLDNQPLLPQAASLCFPRGASANLISTISTFNIRLYLIAKSLRSCHRRSPLSLVTKPVSPASPASPHIQASRPCEYKTHGEISYAETPLSHSILIFTGGAQQQIISGRVVLAHFGLNRNMFHGCNRHPTLP